MISRHYVVHGVSSRNLQCWQIILFLFLAFTINLFPSISSGSTSVGGNITDDTTWTLSNSPYVAISDVVVQTGAKLTIEPGVEIRFLNTKLVIEGDLQAIGTATDNILFTSDSGTPEPGNWGGIRFMDSGFDDQIEYATIEYAVYGIYCRDGSGPVILDSRITNNRYGIYNYYYSTSNGIPNPVVNYSEIFDNQQYNYYNYTYQYYWYKTVMDARYNWWGTSDPLVIRQGIHDYYFERKEAIVEYVPFLGSAGGDPVTTDSEGRLYLQGSVSGSETISAGDYHILGQWLVQPSGLLTIQAGVTLAFDPGAVLKVRGDLVVQGVEGNKVIFTSAASTPQPGDWQGIKFWKSGNGDQIEHAIIDFAEYGVYCLGDSNPVILDSRITNNNYGVYNYYYTWNDGIPNPVVNYNEIFANQQYNYYNNTYEYYPK